MGLKDKDDEKISKVVLDWLTNIVTFITVLAGILSVFLSDDSNANKYAWGLFIPLAIISAFFIYYRYRRAKKLKIAEAVEPLAASATLRGLLPFEDGDQLPGRGRDVQDLYTLVTSSTFRFGVLWGESGCGKTSLLRAGLVSKLRDGNFLPLYIHKPTNNPAEALRLELLKNLPNTAKNNDKSLNQLLKSAAPKNSKVVILFDQFEEFFLTNRTAKSRAGFVKWLGEIIQKENLPVSILIGIRADFFAQLQNFAPQIPEPTSIRTSYQLRNFDSEQAKQIFSAAAKADGIPFEPELIQAVIGELEAEEFVRPAELQVVGTRLKRKNVVTLNKYEALGGARGILSSYINEEIKQSANEGAARLILRLMCAEAVETKSPDDLSVDEIVNGVRGAPADGAAQDSAHPREIQKILDQFVSARVLIHTDENKYNLAHDYLAPYVRTATEGAETHVEHANRMLKRYVAEYKDDPKTRIPFSRMRWINKHASTDLKNKQKAREVIRKSKQAFYSIVAIPLLLIGSLYLFLASTYYLSVDDNYYVVLRQGHPKLDYIPGFDQVMIQTDYTTSDLRTGFDQFLAGKYTGLWLMRTENGSPWGMQLYPYMDNRSRAAILRWLDNDTLVKSLHASNSNDRFDAASAIKTIVQIYPESITPEIVQGLSNLLVDSHFSVRLSAAEAFGSIAQVSPGSISPEIVKELIILLDEPYLDIRLSAVETLRSIAKGSPEYTPEIVLGLINLPDDIEPEVRLSAIETLRSIMQVTPEHTHEIVQELIKLLVASDEDVRHSALYALEDIAKVFPEYTPEIVQGIINLPADSSADVLLRPIGVLDYIVQDNPEYVAPDVVLILINLNNSYAHSGPIGSNYYRMFETSRSIMQDKPENITSEMMRELFNRLTHGDNQTKETAILVLGTIAEVSPENITPEIVQELTNLLEDNDLDIRSSTILAFGSIAKNNPDYITPETVQKLIGLLATRNSDVLSITTSALIYLLPDNPEYIPEIEQKLTELLIDGDYNIRTRATTAFNSIAQDCYESTPEIARLLNNLVAKDIYIGAEYALISIAKNCPENVPPEITQGLISLFAYNNRQSGDAADALISIARVNPEYITPAVVQKLINLHTISPYAFPSARHALRSIAQDNPVYIITPDIMLGLTHLLADTNPGVRPSAVYALDSIAEGSPERITPEIVQGLINLLIDSDSDVRNSAAYALGSIAEGSPEYITPEIVQGLTNLLADSDSDVRNSAAFALGSIAKGNPEYITPEIVQGLTNMLADSTGRYYASSAILSIAKVAPEQITPQVVQELVNWYSAINSISSLNLDGLLISIAKENPEYITSEDVQKFINLLENDENNVNVRSSAINVLVAIAQENPEHTHTIVLGLINLSADPSILENRDSALASIVQNNPDYITPEVMQILINLLSSSRVNVRSSAASVLGFIADVAPEHITPEIISGLFVMLKNNKNAVNRNGAVYALFEIESNASSQKAIIRTELELLQTSQQPHWRFAAGKTLEMIAIGDLVDEARENPEKVEQIKARLGNLSSSDEDHLKHAAYIALREIEKIEAGSAK